LANNSRHTQSDPQGGVLNRGLVAGVAQVMVVVTVLTAPALAQAPQTARVSTTGPAAVVTVTTGSINGTAWKGDTTPYPLARIRLRNMHTGRAIARTDADSDGRFKFLQVDPAPYVVELMSEQDKVLAVGDLFSVTPGNEAATLVRLTSKTAAPWLGGFFGNAAAAVISAASTLGVTAAGSSGRPASVQ
jgi:hypothetical protein